MPEMEKVRPPENKRSRKPAHPVKREINQEMKTFAESTMNELLGWYGYDKVELRDSETAEIRNYPNRERYQQHVSVLKENSGPKHKILDTNVVPSALPMRGGEAESSSVPSSSSSSSPSSSSLTSLKEHKSAPVIVPLIKPSAVEDVQNVQIVCVWCQKEGVKRYSLCMGSELKSFCSEKCFAACRRAYFKRNKARDETLHGGERSPHHTRVDDPPRLVLEMNSGAARVCDWCKHVRHTKEYLDFGAGEERLQFCSTKCLNQYKMDVFYREARAALTSSSPSPGKPTQDGRSSESSTGGGQNQKLLTPESWSSGTGEARGRTRSPKGPTPIHGTAAPRTASPAAASSSSSKVNASGMRHPERHVLPPPLDVASHRPAPAPPPRPPPEHQQHRQATPPFPLPFIRPPLHAQGLKSPLANQPRAHPAPPCSPIHRPPPHSPRHPYLQPPPASSMNPPGMHPYPGAYYPGLHSPPISMLGPRGHVPMPPMMNFGGWPSLGPYLPQPMVLVPYPIIIPLPIPIPIPIPMPSRTAPPDSLGPPHCGVIQPVPEGGERGRSRTTKPPTPGSLAASELGGTADWCLDHTRRDINDWVKREMNAMSPVSSTQRAASPHRTRYGASPASSLAAEGLTDFRLGQQQQPDRQVIQRVVQRTAVKLEPSPHAVVELLGMGEQGVGPRMDHRDFIKHTPPPLQAPPPPHDSQNVRVPSEPPPSPREEGSSPPRDIGTSYPSTSPDAPARITTPPSPAPSSGLSISQKEAPPHGPDSTLSQLEAVTQNCCSNGLVHGRDQGQTTPILTSQSDEPLASGDTEDPRVLDEDHAYALPTPTPTPPKADGVSPASPAALLLPKLRDKGALRSPPRIISTEDEDVEPAAKRRCLRIRDQSK